MDHSERNKKLVLSNKIKKSLIYTDETQGYVLGWKNEDQIFCMCITGTLKHILVGLEVVGFFCESNGTNTENELLCICVKTSALLKIENESCAALFVSKSTRDKEKSICAKVFSPYDLSLSEWEVSTLDYNPAVLVRACGQLPLVFEVTNDSETLKDNIEVGIDKLRTTFHNQVSAFLLKDSNFILHNAATQETCKGLMKLIKPSDYVEKSKYQKNMKVQNTIEFNILVQVTGNAAIETTFSHSVVIHCQRREFQCASLSLPIDVIIVCQESSSNLQIYLLLQSAIDKQLTEMSQSLLESAEKLEVILPEVNHFYPTFWNFPVTLIFPNNKDDKELENYRKELHRQLLLPTDRPFFRRTNSWNFSSSKISGHLINPHEGLGSSGVIGGKCAIVYGRYSYHHYMQDHMNDNGWGCAYRSLQTIISWFRHQGYTEKQVPTHNEIQQALVTIGDKPESFVGSKNWIGSQEVSFCLDHLIQVQSKIMFVNSGAELANKGRELSNHFQDQGTPVMIGGGVLAHTILGVDFNQDTGELKFLILDPHYTGGEDLDVILCKGWCGWKGIQFWDQNAFYNLCMPLRPQLI